MVRTGTILGEEQRSSAVRIPFEKVTRIRILGGQLRSTVGIGTRLKAELRSIRSSIPGDKVGYEMAHGGWTPCGGDLCNGLHEVCVQASVFAKEIGLNWRRKRAATVHEAL
uniref:Uncharacterized protein n=1 Tax=Oryza sativa subsp. japonica TaxID=39947 RepID=Q6K6E1_ORYSJ|nr:hypothetical protein [Oryza sativa Japonica Group]